LDFNSASSVYESSQYFDSSATLLLEVVSINVVFYALGISSFFYSSLDLGFLPFTFWILSVSLTMFVRFLLLDFVLTFVTTAFLEDYISVG